MCLQEELVSATSIAKSRLRGQRRAGIILSLCHLYWTKFRVSSFTFVSMSLVLEASSRCE